MARTKSSVKKKRRLLHTISVGDLDTLVKMDWINAKVVISTGALSSACAHGFMNIVQYLCTTYELIPTDIRMDNNVALRNACENGHLRVVEYLHTTFNLKAEDVRDGNNWTLGEVCAKGHLKVVEYLHDVFKMTVEDARAHDNRALRYACARGHLGVVKYLHDVFGLTVEDVRAHNTEALRLACESRHLEVVKYLFDTFGLTSTDAVSMRDSVVENEQCGIRDYLDTIICSASDVDMNIQPDLDTVSSAAFSDHDNWITEMTAACECGDVPMLKHLCHRVPQTVDVRANDNHMLRVCCKSGSIAAVKQLVNSFGLQASDFRSADNGALEYACANNQFGMIKYLRATIGLTSSDVCGVDNRILRTCCGRGDLTALRCIVKIFKLSASHFRMRDNECLAIACNKGHLSVVKYLFTEIGLMIDDARDRCSYALRMACYSGQLEVVKYLHTTVGMTAKDAQYEKSDPLVHSRLDGHTSVADYLVNVMGVPDRAIARIRPSDPDPPIACGFIQFKVGREIYRAHNLAHLEQLVDRICPSVYDMIQSATLQTACKHGMLDVVAYLCTKFNLTSDNIRVDRNYPLRVALRKGHLLIVQYLVDNYNLTINDARANNNEALRHSCRTGQLGSVKYLHDVFRLTADDVLDGSPSNALWLSYMHCQKHVAEYLLAKFDLPPTRVYDVYCSVLGFENISGDQRDILSLFFRYSYQTTHRQPSLKRAHEDNNGDANDGGNKRLKHDHQRAVTTDTSAVDYHDVSTHALTRQVVEFGKYLCETRIIDENTWTGDPAHLQQILEAKGMVVHTDEITQVRTHQEQVGQLLLKCLATPGKLGFDDLQQQYIALEQRANEMSTVATPFGTSVAKALKKLVEGVGPYIGFQLELTYTPISDIRPL